MCSQYNFSKKSLKLLFRGVGLDCVQTATIAEEEWIAEDECHARRP